MSEEKSLIIVDYGMGNIQSVSHALRLLSVPHQLSSDPETIRSSDALLLPGVGAFGRAMSNLHERNLVKPLQDAVLKRGCPFLGICLGMQILFHRSEESPEVAGLGWLEGEVKLLDASELPIPHVGWNTLKRDDSALFASLKENAHVYFDHSYQVHCDPKFVKATTSYGSSIASVVQKDHIWGMQFHPEKSQRSGLRLLRNFTTEALS